MPVVVAPLGAWLLWAAITTIRPGYAELLDPYRPVWYRLAVVALAAAVLFCWYALLRRRVGPAALAFGGLAWLAVFGVLLAVAVPGGAYLTTLPALAGALAGFAALATRRDGPWPVVAVTLAAAVAVVILLPPVVLLFPALGMGMGAVAALVAVLLGLAVLPVVDLLHPRAGGQRGLLALRARRLGALPAAAAALAAVVLAGVGLAVDRFDAAHPVPTHLMYALDAGTGKAAWLTREEKPQPWTDGYVDRSIAVADEFPGLGNGEMRAGPATAAPLPAPKVETLSDTRNGGQRVLRVRVVPQRQVRLLTMHVDTSTATVRSATVAGRNVPVEPGDGKWGFGVVFHAPPPEGVEVTLTLVPRGGAVSVRAMDASDGLSGVPGFRERPAGVGVVGSHSSEMLAVARTYPL